MKCMESENTRGICNWESACENCNVLGGSCKKEGERCSSSSCCEEGTHCLEKNTHTAYCKKQKDCHAGYVYTWLNPSKRVKMGNLSDNTKSWLNSPTFIGAWNIILESKVWIKSDFTVKADPDAVFFPRRLRSYLKFHSSFQHSRPFFSMNCNFGANNEQEVLFGALEVFNRKSIKDFSKRATHCKDELPWLSHGWGKDRYIQECMTQKIKASHFNMEGKLQDNACGHAKQPPKKYGCDSNDAVAYHPYKMLGEWKQCYANSGGTLQKKRGEGGGEAKTDSGGRGGTGGPTVSNTGDVPPGPLPTKPLPELPPTPVDRCDVPLSSKVDCGKWGIQQQDCEAWGCCWQPAGEGSITPWCYYQSDTHICM